MQKKGIDILFFERPLVDLKKFAFKIAKEIKKKDSSVFMGAVCIELPTEEEKKESFIDYFYHRKQIKNIDEDVYKRQARHNIIMTEETTNIRIKISAIAGQA